LLKLVIRAFAALGAATLVACGGGGATQSTLPVGRPPNPTAQAAANPPVVPAAATRGVLVSVHLPLRNESALDQLIANQTDKSSPEYHQFLTPQQFRNGYGASADAIALTANTLRARGFDVHTTSQGVLASAEQSVVEATFAVRFTAAQSRLPLSLRSLDAATTGVLVPNKAPTLPTAIAGTGASVSFPGIVWHTYSHKIATGLSGSPDNRYSPVGPYWFTDLKQAYGYPSYQAANGTGRKIGIVISSDVSDADSAQYFGHEKLTPTPTVVRRPVAGGNSFTPGTSDSYEAGLDVQQSLGSAPGAQVVLYDIPSLSDANIFAAYSAVVEDNVVDVVNSSFGGCELYYTKAYNGGLDYTSILKQFHDVFRQGNAQGITFVASSGDSGANECVNLDGTAFVKGVSFPAVDTAVTAVGGTNLLTSSIAGSRQSTYVTENAYYDSFNDGVPSHIWGSGGGISTIYGKPPYQYLVNTGSGARTIPDVSMHMGGCPALPCDAATRSAVLSVNGGQYVGLIGTSASSPEFAGLLAVLEGNIGTRLGNANYYIYGLAAIGGSDFYRQNVPGNNGYPTKNGYNYVLGNGTPKAAAFALDPFAPLAGNPQTPTNP